MTTAQRLTHLATKRAEVQDALNHVGTSAESISAAVKTAIAAATAFTGGLIERTAGQSIHDQLINLPRGIYQRSNYLPEQAFRTALAGACGQAVQWDINQALELCAAILEDVNAHSEAAQVRAMIQ